MCARGSISAIPNWTSSGHSRMLRALPKGHPHLVHDRYAHIETHVRAILPWIHAACWQHCAVTVDTVQLTHHLLDGNTATTNYTIDIPAGADTLSHYCDEAVYSLILGTSPVLLLIKERCFTMMLLQRVTI